MALVQKMNGRAMSIPGGVLIGAVSGFLWTVIGAAILAKLIDAEVVKESAIGYGSMMILLTASGLASKIAYGKVKRQRLAVCLAGGGVYFLMLLATTALFFGGQYQAVGVTALLVLAGSSAAVLLGMQKGKGTRKSMHKRHR